MVWPTGRTAHNKGIYQMTKPAWKHANALEEWTVRQDEGVDTGGNVEFCHKVRSVGGSTTYFALLTPYEARKLAEALVKEANYQEAFVLLEDSMEETV